MVASLVAFSLSFCARSTWWNSGSSLIPRSRPGNKAASLVAFHPFVLATSAWWNSGSSLSASHSVLEVHDGTVAVASFPGPGLGMRLLTLSFCAWNTGSSLGDEAWRGNVDFETIG